MGRAAGENNERVAWTDGHGGDCQDGALNSMSWHNDQKFLEQHYIEIGRPLKWTIRFSRNYLKLESFFLSHPVVQWESWGCRCAYTHSHRKLRMLIWVFGLQRHLRMLRPVCSWNHSRTKVRRCCFFPRGQLRYGFLALLPLLALFRRRWRRVWRVWLNQTAERAVQVSIHEVIPRGNNGRCCTPVWMHSTWYWSIERRKRNKGRKSN